MKKTNKRFNRGWYFLIGVVILYGIIYILGHGLFVSSLHFFIQLILKILPVFGLVFVLMLLANLLITPRIVKQYLAGAWFKQGIFAVVGGILSTGPIYMWYPLLKDLRQKGFSSGHLATFLYNRAIKLPLLPVAIFYFGVKYVLILTIVMIFVSIIQGFIIDHFIPEHA
jgi:uncharacterized membrane protein YraQ (UPF0718 family)